VDKDVDDLDIELSDALDRSEWRRMIGGNWNDSDAKELDTNRSFLVPAN